MGRTGTLWAYEQTGVVPDAHDAGQGARRRAADRRARHRAASRRRASRPATTARPSPAARWSARPPTPRSTSSTTRRSSSGARAGHAAGRGLRELPGVSEVRGARADGRRRARADAPALVRARAGRAAARAQRHRAPHAALPAAARVTEAEIDDALGRLGRRSPESQARRGPARRVRPGCGSGASSRRARQGTRSTTVAERPRTRTLPGGDDVVSPERGDPQASGTGCADA